MRRITVEEVKAAMDKTGLSLKPGVNLDKVDQCGCPLAILIVASGVTPHPWLVPGRMIQGLGLDVEYGWGLVSGFEYQHPSNTTNEPRRAMGIEDGRAIRDALCTVEAL